MKIETIAEFVGNDKIMKVLKSIGVDFAQGHYIQKTVPLKSLLTAELAPIKFKS